MPCSICFSDKCKEMVESHHLLSGGISMKAARIRIFIADDSQIFIQAAIDLLAKHSEMEIVGAVCDADRIVKDISGCSPDIILLDFEMHSIVMADLILKLKTENKPRAVIALALTDTPAFRKEARKDGADGFVAKAHLGRDLVEKIKTLASGVA